MSSITFEPASYGGWDGCHRLSNGVIDLMISGGFGPRVLFFGFTGGDNELAEIYDGAAKVPADQFRLYGGHRFWHAPEAQPRTYYPDNNPVDITFADGVLTLAAPTESTTGMQKTLHISLDPTGARVLVTHSLTNTGLWPVQVAPWALTCMAPGGTAILPLPPRGSHSENLLPSSHLVLWAYTDFSDPRWTFTPEALLLKADGLSTLPQKIGAPVAQEWLGYARNGHLFVKQFEHRPSAEYPDGGCSGELFVIDYMLEVESLGALVMLQPGETVDHVETWHLLDGVPEPRTAADVAAHITPLVAGL
ncbi:MAG: DUF4380 domain-containing protein [Anaerolineae bacterium]|nr:DUF4380 domain-containing protein [Anaerolineae bacterium]